MERRTTADGSQVLGAGEATSDRGGAGGSRESSGDVRRWSQLEPREGGAKAKESGRRVTWSDRISGWRQSSSWHPFIQKELDAVRPEVDTHHRRVVEEKEPRV